MRSFCKETCTELREDCVELKEVVQDCSMDLVEDYKERFEDCTGCVSKSSLLDPESFHSQYLVLKTIGRGGSAKIKLAQHRLTGCRVAVKVFQNRKMWCFPIMSEAGIMRKMNHPNIVSLLQVIDSDKRTYLIMELVEGQQLLEYVLKARHLQKDDARRLFRQILSAVSYCHKCGIIHRDLKLDNIMVDKNGEVKIIDFGLAAQVMPGQKITHFLANYCFAAPEFFLDRLYDGHKLDIWALGAVLHFMVSGKFPSFADTSSELKKQIVRGKYTVPLSLSEDLQDLLRCLMTVNPSQRPTVDEVMTHPWLRKDREALPNPHEEIVPSLPDPAIVQAMELIGFQAEDIKDSVCQRKCDCTMASYYLLQGQAHQGNSCTISPQPINPGVAPFPSLEDLAAFPPPPRRRNSEPALGTLIRGSSTNGQMSAYGQQAGQRGDRRASESALPLCRPLQRTLTLDQDHQRSQSAPCTYSVSGSNEKTEDNLCSPSASAEGKSTHSRGQHRGWRRWTRRIGNPLMALCCCCFPSRQNTVSLQK